MLEFLGLGSGLIVVWFAVAVGVAIGVGLALLIWRITGPLRLFGDLGIYGGGIFGLHAGILMVESNIAAEYGDTLQRLDLFLALAFLIKLFIFVIAFALTRTVLQQAEKMTLMVAEILAGVLVFVFFGGVLLQKPLPEMIAVGIVVVGAIGVIGKRVMENIARGIAISVDEHMNVDDWVTYGDKVGLIREITPTHLVMETPIKERILIPHRLIYENAIVNHSRPETRRGRRRGQERETVIGADIKFRLGYEHSPREVRRLIRQYLEKLRQETGGMDGGHRLLVAYTLTSPPGEPSLEADEHDDTRYRPSLFADDFGDYYISYRLRVFLGGFSEYFAGTSKVRMELFDFLIANGLSMPYPVLQYAQYRGRGEAEEVPSVPIDLPPSLAPPGSGSGPGG